MSDTGYDNGSSLTTACETEILLYDAENWRRAKENQDRRKMILMQNEIPVRLAWLPTPSLERIPSFTPTSLPKRSNKKNKRNISPMPSTLVPGAMHTDQDTWGWLGQDWGSDEMSEGEDWDSASSDTLPGTPLVGWKATSLPPALGEDAGAADEGRSWGRSW